MAHIRQSRADSDRGCQAKVLDHFEVISLLLESGRGVPRSWETPPPLDLTVALCLGTYCNRRGVGVSHERGTPVSDRAYLRQCID